MGGLSLVVSIIACCSSLSRARTQGWWRSGYSGQTGEPPYNPTASGILLDDELARKLGCTLHLEKQAPSQPEPERQRQARAPGPQ